MTRTIWDQKKKNEWEKNSAFWIRIMQERLDPFRNKVTNAAVLNALPQKRGLRILDAGCGEGYFCRLMARRGMKVTGIDISPALIQAAKEEKTQNKISYRVADMRDIPFPSLSFDVVVSHQSIHETNEPKKALLEFSRVLSREGKLILLFSHPCFDFWQDEFAAQKYFKAQKVQKSRYLVGGISSPAPYFYLHLPLEEWVQIIRSAGFSIESISEPRPSLRLMRKPWWKQNFSRPSFILIEAKKRERRS